MDTAGELHEAEGEHQERDQGAEVSQFRHADTMDTGAIDRRECFDNVNRIPLPGSGCIQNQAWLSDVLSERLEEWVGWSNGTRLVVWGCALHSGRFFL